MLDLLHLAEFYCFTFWDEAKLATAMHWCYLAVYIEDQKCSYVYPWSSGKEHPYGAPLLQLVMFKYTCS